MGASNFQEKIDFFLEAYVFLMMITFPVDLFDYFFFLQSWRDKRGRGTEERPDGRVRRKYARSRSGKAQMWELIFILLFFFSLKRGNDKSINDIWSIFFLVHRKKEKKRTRSSLLPLVPSLEAKGRWDASSTGSNDKGDPRIVWAIIKK